MQDSRERAAALQADLEAALALRAAHAGQLARMPRILDGAPNPIHQRRTIQLDQQDALIATLRRRLAALGAQIDEPERPPRSPSDGPLAGPADQRGFSDGAAPSLAPGTRRTVASMPAGPVPATSPARLALLTGVMVLAGIAGAAVAVWRGGRDGIIDHPSQLQHYTALPVLCRIALPGPTGQDRQARAGRRQAALAGLGLIGLFVLLVVAERLGIPAPLGEGLPSGCRR